MSDTEPSQTLYLQNLPDKINMEGKPRNNENKNNSSNIQSYTIYF